MSKLWSRCWGLLRAPSTRFGAGTLLVVGAVSGMLFWGGFTSFVHSTNSLEFCISCHEMRDTVYQEYKQSSHYANSSGVKAICSDCHVPKAFVPKIKRKIQATFNEVPKHLLGTIDTKEKFEARRLILAGHVWDEMKANDSQECRGCHDRKVMLLSKQKPRAKAQHEDALKTGETCIDCHKGIAHEKPKDPTKTDAVIGADDEFSL